MLYSIFQILRFLFFGIDLFITIIFSFLLAYIPVWPIRRYSHHLFRNTCWGFIRFLGIECHIHQKYKAPLPKHYILISNHPSGCDILILNALFSVYPLAKDEVKKWWFLGRIAKAAGVVFVKREDKDSRHSAKEIMLECIKQGKKLLIYPEGGCYGKHLRPFKYGAFDLSIRSEVPILPVYFQYEAENNFEWYNTSLPRHLYNIFTASNKHMHCYIFNPIYPEMFDTSQSFAEYVHQFYRQCETKYRLY